MLVRPAPLLVSAALALTLAACGGSSDGGATEKEYAAKAEVACARSLSAGATARASATTMRTEQTPAARRRFFDDYAEYFTVGVAALGVLADTPAPKSYDAFRAGSKRQDDYLSPIFRSLAARARASSGTDDIRGILASVSAAQKNLPSVPNPPAAFARLAPSCAKVAAQ
ncbi:hypothetical protein [Patulibacter minatonensis]|uniref:hypothetical protein n=1 Tax=Patulibacter minatonensis TaxID=298163 RepID=UPI00047C40D8|nr:hypothetical protein [Patulibacter minatonensis]